MKGLKAIGIYLAFALAFSACTLQPETKNAEVKFSCDAELIDSTGKFLLGDSANKQIAFELGGTHSLEYSKSGKYAVKVDAKKAYALTFKLKSLKGNERYKASIWRYDPSGKSALVVAGNKTHMLYKAQKEPAFRTKNGWELLEVEFDITPALDYVKIYAWRIDADSAWFDDLSIEQLPQIEYPSYSDQAKLHLYFQETDWQILENTRKRAFLEGILVQNESDWATGILSDELDVLPVKARLKGDWLDHLEGVKWSYRIKMRKDKRFNGLQVFSLQSPETRSFLSEYLAHTLFLENQVLSTKYEFTPLYVNGQSRGIYALEEHFTKQLVEANQRREGIIVRFNEEAFWGIQKYLKLENKWYVLPYFQASLVESFQSSKALAEPLMKTQFSIAQSLMYQYKNHIKPIDQVFDIDKFAKYWALVDLTKARHGMAWHNQRFYYNPILCLLEPIAFDAYMGAMVMYKEDRSIFGNMWFPDNAVVALNDELLYKIFQDEQFQEKYLQYLKLYSDPSFVSDFLAEHREEIQKNENLIREEYPEYKYDRTFLVSNANQIRTELPLYKNRLASGVIQSYLQKAQVLTIDTLYRKDLAPLFVNAFVYKDDGGIRMFEAENYYGRSIQLVGLSDKQNRIRIEIPSEKSNLNPYQLGTNVISFPIGNDSTITHLAFRVDGKTELLYTSLHPWQKKMINTPRQELLNSNVYQSGELFAEKGDTLILEKGNYQLKKLLLIPANKFIVFEKGVELDMVNGGGILFFSPIYMNGREQEPIRIFSSDSTSLGFGILQASKESTLTHVSFEGLKNFAYKGWELTGCVNFYESDVQMSFVHFKNNHSEDALNIVRSEFRIDHASFENISSDAFDGDFVHGQVNNSTFENITNDALDFSGSQVTVNDCKINHAGDKGISAGENSQLVVNRIRIENGNIGMASKDWSRIEATGVELEGLNYGLLVFQKKPEYSSAEMYIDKVNFKQIKYNYLIEINSKFRLNERVIIGNQKKLAEKFY
ncbi:MAG: CotH kinase family protein [Bacteroidales bacterium]|nr:CotH kinase family protein [Bacteroidales bacterium]